MIALNTTKLKAEQKQKLCQKVNDMLDIMPDREFAIVNVKEIKQIGKEREENDINWVVL